VPHPVWAVFAATEDGAVRERDVGEIGLLVPVAMSATHVAFSAVRMDPTWMAMGQAAGVAAVLSLRAGVPPRALDVAALQRELIRQKCRLMFYWAVPLDHPAFAAIQWLSVRQVVGGYPDRTFQPDQPLTRAELATLAVQALAIWPSVTNQHFEDVSYRHWAFREIETLYDHRMLKAFGILPRWTEAGRYDPAKYGGFPRGKTRDSFLPESPVTWGQLVGTLRPATSEDDSAWLRRTLGASKFGRNALPKTWEPERPVTRGEACILVASVLSPDHGK
jgi:hypothetical protein